MFDWLIPELPKRTRDVLTVPEPTWPRLLDGQIRLRELENERLVLEVRRLEALAKLRKEEAQHE